MCSGVRLLPAQRGFAWLIRAGRVCCQSVSQGLLQVLSHVTLPVGARTMRLPCRREWCGVAGADLCIGGAKEPKGGADIDEDEGNISRSVGDAQGHGRHCCADFVR